MSTPSPLSLTLSPPPSPATSLEIATAFDTAQRLVLSILARIPSTPISSLALYHDADSVLGALRSADQDVTAGFEPYIRPLREFLDELYALRRQLAKPLGEGEDKVKRLMADWDLAERQRKAKEQAEREKAERVERARVEKELTVRREAEAEELARKADEERRAGEGVRARETEKRAEAALLDPLPQVTVSHFTIPVAPPPRPQHSSSSLVKKWRVVDRQAALEAMVTGLIPESVEGVSVLNINEVAVNKAMRGEGWKRVGEWPGFEVYDDSRITGR